MPNGWPLVGLGGSGYARRDHVYEETSEKSAKEFLAAHKAGATLGQLKKEARATSGPVRKSGRLLYYDKPGRGYFLTVFYRPRNKKKKYVFATVYRSKTS
jgi:hypothetical protein